VGPLVDPQRARRRVEHRQAGDLLDRADRGGGADRDPLQDPLGPRRSHRDEHRADPVECRGQVARVIQTRAADVQPTRFAEGAAGLAWVTNQGGDRIAARECAADDLAADAAGGADHRGGHRFSFR